MNKIIKIEGMMCEKCENKVKNALSKLGAVESVSKDRKEAVLNNTNADNETINKIIDDLGFEVTNILDK